MKKTFLLLPAIVLLAAGCGSQSAAPQSSQPSADNSQTVQSAPPAASSQKLVDQDYYKNAYLISDSALSADAQKALTGFQMSKQTLKDGSLQITLKALKTEYKDQQYTLTPGEKLYFIERFMGDDDQEANEDKNIMDDMAVVVDTQGNIVGKPGGWSK